MDRIALQILEDGWEQDGRTMRRAVGILRDRLAESSDGRSGVGAVRPRHRSRPHDGRCQERGLPHGKHRIAAIVRRAAAEPGRPAEPRAR